MYKVSLEEVRGVDYIYCLSYHAYDAVRGNFLPLEVTNTTVECNLDQRQRSSQQILDLADFIQMHLSYQPIRKYKSSSSFSSDIPLWVELANPKSIFGYFEAMFESNDVMVIWDDYNKPSNFNDIKEFCGQKNWRFTERLDITGSEASVTILYDLSSFNYEYFTRAKTQLVILTIAGKQRYFFNFLKVFLIP